MKRTRNRLVRASMPLLLAVAGVTACYAVPAYGAPSDDDDTSGDDDSAGDDDDTSGDDDSAGDDDSGA